MPDLKDYALTKEDVFIIRTSLMTYKGIAARNAAYIALKHGKNIDGLPSSVLMDLIQKINCLLAEKLT